ncbi:MAG: macro domain-containing protein, partial [Planctomycetales bacterium]
IHAVGPVWRGGEEGEAEQLASAFSTSLAVARDNNCRSIALPALSTGVYGYPWEQAAEITLSAAIDFLQREGVPELVRFVLYPAPLYHVFEETLYRLIRAASE